jgi:hypothetical protein
VSASRPVVTAVCLLLLLGTVTAPATALPSTTAGAGAADAGTGTVLASPLAGSSALATVQANNTTRHRNPAVRNQEGDLAAVRDHLAGEMGRVIVECSQAVRIGEFDPCEGLNGTYSDSLSKYVAVSRTAGSDDGESARSFRDARREGREYARNVRQFRETYEAYREARKEGNASRAREEARDLRDLADETSRTGGNLSRSLGNVTRGGTDVRSARQAVNETTENVTRSVDAIERELFVETNTTARLDSSVGSFRDPLVVTGRVTTANGTAVEDARVGLFRVRDGGLGPRVRARALTNATGHYRLVYRPVTVTTGPGTFAARLLPSVASPYLPSNATMRAHIEQVRATLAVESAPDASSYGDRLRVRTRVAVGGLAVEDLPITTRIGEYQIGRVRTDGDGEATPDGRFPLVVESGERTMVVGYEERDRAIAPVTESVRLEVRETATTLESTVRLTTDRSVVVEGRLTTADGRALEDRAVRVALAGRSLGTLRSDANGSFDGNLTVPASVLPVEGSAERPVRLVFDGSGTNLASTETTVSVTLLAPEDSALPVGEAPLSIVLAALLLVAVAGVVLLRRRPSGTAGPGPHGAASGEDVTSAEPSFDAVTVLESIRAAMDAGDYDLVTTAGYRAVRHALAGRVAAPPGATHWEFYGACAADGFDPERLDAVRRLTERFERVVFASTGASRSVAAAALTDVERVLEDAGDGDDGDADVDAPAATGDR